MLCRSVAVKPGEKEAFTLVPQSDLRITNVALGEELADPSGRTSVKLTYLGPSAEDDEDDDEDDEDDDGPSGSVTSTILCSLTPGKVRYQNRLGY